MRGAEGCYGDNERDRGEYTRFRKKRLQDDQVVSGVVATCILSTLWYLFA